MTSPGKLARGATAVAVGLVLTSAVAGCGSSSDSTSGAGSGDLGLIIDVNGPLSDPFFSSLKKGTDDAASDLGVKYKYSAPANENNLVPDITQLLNEAISQKPAAIIVNDAVPTSFDPLIKKATDAGIKVVIVNNGLPSWEDDGALTYVGEDPAQTGQSAGTAMTAAGAKNILCVDHVPANPALGERCTGAASVISAAGGTSDVLNIPASDNGNPAAVTQDIQGYLRSHPDVDGVITLGSAIATNAESAIDNLGKTGEVTVGTTDISTAVLNDVESGKLDFVVDQQPYLQGYYSLQVAAQDLKYGVHPTDVIATGGLIVDKSNVAGVLKVQKQYAGLRGAQ